MMRRWLVLLMVLLLPLRAVAGDAMSLGMALAGEPAVLSAGMAPDCPMHQAATDASPGVDDDGSSTPAAECESCALCFPVAQAAVAVVVGARAPADARPTGGDDRFPSAPLRGLLRPPRS